MDWDLFEAAESGDANILHQKPSLELNLNQTTPRGNTLLHIAATSNHREFAIQVISLCPSLLLKSNSNGDTPLHIAATTGHCELVEALLDGANQIVDIENRREARNIKKKMVTRVNKDNETVLDVALRHRRSCVGKLLVQLCPELLDRVGEYGETESALFLAVQGHLGDVVLRILETSPMCAFRGVSGMTALHAAVLKPTRRRGIVKILLERRPDMVKEVDSLGRTPLHYAALKGHHDIVRLILRTDASVAYILDKDGLSALHIAALSGYVDIMEILVQSCEYIWELRDENGRNVLHIAVIAERADMVKSILQMPKLVGLINERDREGNTPLHLAAASKKFAVITILARDKRVDKYAVNKDYYTARDEYLLTGKEISFRDAKARFHLAGSGGLLRHQVDAGEYIKGKLKHVNLEAKKGQATDSVRSLPDLHLVIATLIATVTFAAAFTLPGGLKPDPPGLGLANFVHKAAFKVFVISDSLSFLLSSTAIGLEFYAATSSTARPRFVRLTMNLIEVAIVGMGIAFASALYVVLVRSMPLALSAYRVELSKLTPSASIPFPSLRIKGDDTVISLALQ
ncbi:PGG domain, partial [Dillenia turbinata]